MRSFSFTQQFTWGLPADYCGRFDCLDFFLVLGGGKMSLVLKCVQTGAPSCGHSNHSKGIFFPFLDLFSKS